MSPLALTNVQNVSAIVLPGSLASDAEVMTLSMDLYYLIYYQQVETVLRADRALEILEVNVMQCIELLYNTSLYLCSLFNY